MRSNNAEAPRGIMTELRAALDAIPADEPRHDLRQSLQLLVPLVEQMHQRLQALEARLEALESGDRRGEVLAGQTRRPEGGLHCASPGLWLVPHPLELCLVGGHVPGQTRPHGVGGDHAALGPRGRLGVEAGQACRQR
jgi:hypothetical protein